MKESRTFWLYYYVDDCYFRLPFFHFILFCFLLFWFVSATDIITVMIDFWTRFWSHIVHICCVYKFCSLIWRIWKGTFYWTCDVCSTSHHIYLFFWPSLCVTWLDFISKIKTNHRVSNLPIYKTKIYILTLIEWNKNSITLLVT